MRGEKRGLLLLVLVVALLVFSSVAYEKNEAMYKQVNLQHDDCKNNCDALSKECCDKDLVAEMIPGTNTNNEIGCKIHTKATACDNDGCADGRAFWGTTFNMFPSVERMFSGSLYYSSSKVCDGDGISYCKDGAMGLLKNSQIYSDGPAYLCANTNNWHACTLEPESQETVVWANQTIWKCITEETNSGIKYANWVNLGIDQDRDGYSIDEGDCYDNPENDPPICSQIKDPDSCVNLVAYSQCAICINPHAPEVCGDGIGSGDSNTEYLGNDCNVATSDDCNDFREGCSQSSISVDNFQEGAWDGSHTNIYDTPFPWVQTGTDGEGFCCGFDGLDDHGVIIDAEGSSSGQFVCLNEKLTGTELPKLPGDGAEEGAADFCKGGWCLVTARSDPNVGGGRFTIFTINKPGEKSYDLVSNSEEWLVCDKDSVVGPLTNLPLGGLDPTISEGDLRALSNRFYCYQEGDHYSWAECAANLSNRRNKGIKGRYPGEGLYSLPLILGEEEGGIKTSSKHIVDIDLFNYYQTFYDKNYISDFSGYKYFNFMFQFCEGSNCQEADVLTLDGLNDYLPLKLELEFLGEGYSHDEDIPIFEKEVLGDVTNGLQFDSKVWMHVKTEIPSDLKGVRRILIQTSDATNLRIKNVYLSKDESATELCSGKEDVDDNSWLDDIDQGTVQQDMVGDELCKSLYGDNAWLGKDGDINNDYEDANCCGDDEHEYYAGPSLENTNKERFGCWNSQVLTEGQTTFDVEYKVTFKEKKIDLTYPNITFDVDYKFEGQDFVEIPGPFPSTEIQSYPSDSNNGYVNGTTYYYEERGIYIQYLNYNVTFYFNSEITAETSPIVIDTIELGPNESILYSGDLGIAEDYAFKKHSLSTLESEKVKVYFYDPLQQINEGTELTSNDLSYPQSTIYIMAEIIPETYTVSKDITYPLTTEKPYSFPCNQQECIYPVPGIPDKEITIKNSHPELYDLYYITLDTTTGNVKEQFIGEERTFTVPGNIKAKRVPQQIIFHTDGDDAKFYGCQATDYIQNNVLAQFYLDQNHCSIISGKFCSPSVNLKEINGQDRYTIVNSWSNESLDQIGYEPIETESDDFETYFENLILTLKLELIPADQRNHTTSVVPVRNIIPNAEFRYSNSQIPHWELLENDDIIPNEHMSVDDNVVDLSGNKKLISEKIAINSSGTYFFSNNGTSDYDIYNDNSTKITLTNGIFSAEGTEFITIQFNSGLVYQPFLQLVDDFGVGEYNYGHQEYPDNYDFRSGLSCCKEDQCWNGYTCVDSMEDAALMTEHFGVGKDYRCINGEWTHLPVKWDWNSKKWGFCSQEEQCFVTKNGEADNTVNSFLDLGKPPICINTSESILDHYCQDGQWTSRTKFLASKLVEVAGNDEFVLYCTHYTNSLLDFGDEIYLGGKSQEEDEEVPSLEDGIIGLEQDAELSYTCFPEIWKATDGKNLVQQDENTCINNMCVLRYKEGDQFKTAFATTLNKNITDVESSFLLSLNIAQEELNTICVGTGDFVKCDFEDADMWYSSDLNALVYGKNEIQLTPGIFTAALNSFLDWFKDLVGIGTELPEFEQFVFKASNFNEIYLLNKEGKTAKVVKEVVNGSNQPQQSILAEYEGFTTPICQYVDNLVLPSELQTEPLQIASGYNKYNCTSEEGKQKLQFIVNEADSKGLDYFWPQLTGKLRVGSFN